MSAPTLSGAQLGHVQPWREIEGGIWMYSKDGILESKPAAVRIIRRADKARCMDYARQYLQGRADKVMLPHQLEEHFQFFRAHLALIQVPQDAEAKLVELFPLPATIADATGKLSAPVVALLDLHRLADGQLERIGREYELLTSTETPDRTLTSAEWEAIVEEGKEQPLKTLHSRHGSSRLIQVLHGLSRMGGDWPE